MQAVRLINQSFISSIKTGSPWDSGLQAGVPSPWDKRWTCLPNSVLSYLHSHVDDNYPALPAREQVKSIPQWFAQSHAAIQLLASYWKAQEIWNGGCTWFFREYIHAAHLLAAYTELFILEMFFPVISSIQVTKKKKKSLLESSSFLSLWICLGEQYFQVSLSFPCVGVCREEIMYS